MYLWWREATVNLYQSVSQAGTVRMNLKPSNPCFLSCRIWLQNSFPSANVMSMQLDWGRGNGVTLLQVFGWAASGQAEERVFDRVQIPRACTHPECRSVFTWRCQSRFFCLFCCRHQLVEMESFVWDLHSQLCYVQRSRCLLLVSK